jgi:hypothetical protein
MNRDQVIQGATVVQRALTFLTDSELAQKYLPLWARNFLRKGREWKLWRQGASQGDGLYPPMPRPIPPPRSGPRR